MLYHTLNSQRDDHNQLVEQTCACPEDAQGLQANSLYTVFGSSLQDIDVNRSLPTRVRSIKDFMKLNMTCPSRSSFHSNSVWNRSTRFVKPERESSQGAGRPALTRRASPSTKALASAAIKPEPALTVIS